MSIIAKITIIDKEKNYFLDQNLLYRKQEKRDENDMTDSKNDWVETNSKLANSTVCGLKVKHFLH